MPEFKSQQFKPQEAKVVLGIDPGLRITGYSLLYMSDRGAKILDLGFLELSKLKEISERVWTFHNFLEEKIKAFNVDVVSLETPFLGKKCSNVP